MLVRKQTQQLLFLELKWQDCIQKCFCAPILNPNTDAIAAKCADSPNVTLSTTTRLPQQTNQCMRTMRMATRLPTR